MPLITGCTLYVDERSTTTAYSLEQARRLAVPHINKRQAIKLEISVTAHPTQVWIYDHETREWVLQR
ncbi:MAG: hypothetical protein MUP61_02105 [Burkholderiales bacterium]|nr:hypothetical protein [Burkholderiales bacterium]MCJ7837995.1 hypothetical protein [Burkholderiales bacterium]